MWGQQPGSLGVVQEDTNNFLDALWVSCIQDSCVIGVLCELSSDAIGGFLPGMWYMFWVLGMWVPKLFEGTFDVPRHG